MMLEAGELRSNRHMNMCTWWLLRISQTDENTELLKKLRTFKAKQRIAIKFSTFITSMLQEWSEFLRAHPNVDYDHYVNTTTATTMGMFLMADICKSNGACARSSRVIWPGRNWVNIIRLRTSCINGKRCTRSNCQRLWCLCIQGCLLAVKRYLTNFQGFFKSQDVHVACFVPAPLMPALIARESGQTEEET